MASSPHGINNQSDTRELHVYENQRWRPISGYTDRCVLWGICLVTNVYCGVYVVGYLSIYLVYYGVYTVPSKINRSPLSSPMLTYSCLLSNRVTFDIFDEPENTDVRK